MTYSIHLTQDWPPERLHPYENDINQAMQTLIQRFPDDISLPLIAKELSQGTRQLWLILNEQQQFMAFLISQIEITPRQRKRLCLSELAGKGGVKLASLLDSIEAWALKNDITQIVITGRKGWKRAFKQQGFSSYLISYKKDISHE